MHKHIPDGATGALRCAAGPDRACGACQRVAPASEVEVVRLLGGTHEITVCRDRTSCAERVHRLHHSRAVPNRDCEYCSPPRPRPRSVYTALGLTLLVAVTLALTGCAPARPAATRITPVSVVTCSAPNPDAGACHGNVWVPS